MFIGSFKLILMAAHSGLPNLLSMPCNTLSSWLWPHVNLRTLAHAVCSSRNALLPTVCMSDSSFFRCHLDITSTGRPSVTTSLKWIDLTATSPNSRSSHPTAKMPTPCPEQGQVPPGSFSSTVSAVELVRAAGHINHCLGTCVCADAGTRDCLSFFLQPGLKFTRVINGLASTIKATSITHSAKEGPEASVSCLFFSRQRRAMLKRSRKKWPSHPAVPWGVRPRDAGFHVRAPHWLYPPPLQFKAPTSL